jgi:diguanylate cyclase (GGDEF)-like protein
LIAPVLAALASLLTAGLTWHRSRTPGLRPFRALCLCTGAWALLRVLELSSGEPSAQAALGRLQHAGLLATALAWLAFAAAYAGLARGLRPRLVVPALAPALAALVLTASGRTGPGHALGTGYAHLLTAAGAAIALSSLTRHPRRGGRVAAVVAGCAMVLGGSALALLEPDLLNGLDPMCAGYAVASVVLGASLFRRRLVELAPVARSLVVEDLPDGVIVLDDQDRIVDCNAAAEALLGQPIASLLGSGAARALPASLSERLGSGGAAPVAIAVAGRNHEATVRPLGRSSVAPEGRVILLRDVTERHHAEQELIVVRAELQRAHAERQQLANTDALTGLCSRRYFLERLGEEVARGRRHGEPLSLLMIDLDGFKQVNERWGHLAGDQVLATVAALARAVKRETDLAGRLGGEELGLMLPATDEAGARRVAERLMARLRAEPYDAADGTRFKVTASIGLAMLSDEHPSGDSLLAGAARALGRAKQGGRDRVAE